MKDSPQLVKRRRYDAAFRAEALRLAAESRSIQAAARALSALNCSTSGRKKRLRPWLRPVGQSWTPPRRQTAAVARLGAAAGAGTGDLKKAIAIFSVTDNL